MQTIATLIPYFVALITSGIALQQARKARGASKFTAEIIAKLVLDYSDRNQDNDDLEIQGERAELIARSQALLAITR